MKSSRKLSSRFPHLAMASLALLHAAPFVLAAPVTWSSKIYPVNGGWGQFLNTGVFDKSGTLVIAENVGGGATKEKVTEAFKIITSDPNVKGILVNIFGGIMRCDIIAEGVIAAVKEVGLKVPLVVRLEGTNVELGKEIIRNSGLNVIAADNLSDAAKKIVKAVKG